MNFTTGAILALTLLAACGGEELAPLGPNLEPGPSIPVQEPSESLESKDLGVSGKLSISGSGVTVNLDVSAGGEYVTDAEVRVAGQQLAFDASQRGFFAELSPQALPLTGPVDVEVKRGDATHRRTLVVPGGFEVQAPESITVETDLAVSWSGAAGATGYRVYLTPEDGAARGGELASEVRTHAFNALTAPGAAVLEVIAIAQNLDGDARSNVEVLRIERRAVTVVAEEPEPAADIAVSGLITLADGYAIMNLDVAVEGEYVLDAAVQVNGNELPFVQTAHGYYAELPVSALPASDVLSVEVTHDGVKHTRALTVPGPYSLQVPETAVAGEPVSITWSASADATVNRVYFRHNGAFVASATIYPGSFKYTVGRFDGAGTATCKFMAVTTNVGDGPNSTVEIQRVDQRTINVASSS